ncbi:MAG: 5'/3'-nucleotidase SurE [Muribaculaceae bacterium]|nr:5'/3'-nucleotidase SurE [Muribaculaceae bacterium]
MKPLILITNDDGIEAKGIEFLAKQVAPLGDVVVVAPDSPRSGQSCAITVTKPLQLFKVKEEGNVIYYKTTGTPVDCIKLAINDVLERRPDMILSGINHGSNSGVSTMYSGTMGAAYEGAILGIPSVGFSLCDHSPSADFTPCAEVVNKVCKAVLKNGLPASVCLNVNVPVGVEIKGIKVCKQAMGYWTEEYNKIVDSNNQVSYSLTGHFVNTSPKDSTTDEDLLTQGYITIVPTSCDRTATSVISYVENIL